MKIFGYGIAIFSIVFFFAMLHGIRMYGIQGDPRWMMTIIGCPIFGVITAAFGLTIAST